MQWQGKHFVCKMSRQATIPGPLHHHRGQTDVTVDLQGGNVLEGSVAMPKGVCLHPIGHNPEGVLLTADSQLKGKKAFQNNII